MAKAARRLTDAVDGFLAGHRVLICDRDGKWTDAFRGLLDGVGVRIALTPVQAPNANAYAERFVRSIREECLDQLILFGEGRLIGAVDEFVAHYHRERNHQGLGNRLITPGARQFSGTHIRCHERLGGMLRYYHRAAWPSDESSDTTRTTLMVAHRLTTIRQVDKVLVVDQGRLTDAGAPEICSPSRATTRASSTASWRSRELGWGRRRLPNLPRRIDCAGKAGARTRDLQRLSRTDS